jgi:hypothetical protein
MNRERLFCSKPFTWFEVSRGVPPGSAQDEEFRPAVEGETFLCCPNWLNKPVGNLLRSSVEELWNGRAAADIRRSILDGSFEYCSRSQCPYLQTQSGPVQPVAEVADPLMRRVIDEQLTMLPWGPLEINASYDRSCNLSCPSCRTHVIMEHDRHDEIMEVQRKLNDEALKQARLLYITGSGDPFGSPFFRSWLQTMKRADMPALETIHLHTNALLWTPRVWETIPEEIRVLVRIAEISIDAATAATYAENRQGGHFDRLLQNLEFISAELRARGPLEWLGISMVVQRNNFQEMAEFVRLGQQFNVDSIYFSQLANWGTFGREDYRERAIHLPTHADHALFLERLKDPILSEPKVDLGNLTSIREALARTGSASRGASVRNGVAGP